MKALIVYENDTTYLDKVNGVIMPLSSFSVGYLNKYSISEIKEFINNNKNLEVFVVINKNIFNHELALLEDILYQLNVIGVTGVFYYDLAVLSIFRKHNFDFELVWNQTHMVTNFNTINYYVNKGVWGAVISNEITFDEILDIRKNTECKLFVNVVYCPIMSFSRRKLLSNYCKSCNIKLDNNKLDVSECSSGYKITIVEEDDGTALYSKKMVNNLDVVDNYKNENIDYVIMDLSFLEDKSIKRQVVDTLYSILNDFSDKTDMIKITKDMIGSNSGFLYRKTIYKVK